MSMAALVRRIDAYEKLIRLDRPIGILLLLWPTLWALWLAAKGVPPYATLWLFVLGTVLMRSAGCAINDYADRSFDAHVERTRARPLAAGAIQPWEAIAVAVVLALAALAVVLRFNKLTVLLSVPAVVIAATYPFTKRFFWLPQAYLGLAFGFGMPMAFAAVTDEVPPLVWALLATHVFWTIAYDTEYAMVDREDDLRIGIRTSALLFGRHDVAAVVACYAVFLMGMVAIGLWQRYGPLYFAGIFVSACLVAYHYRLIRERSRAGCFKAFLHNNWVGAAIFAGIVLDNVRWADVMQRISG
jgi:4-hydroxybenzoate polyprenyltransferase